MKNAPRAGHSRVTAKVREQYIPGREGEPALATPSLEGQRPGGDARHSTSESWSDIGYFAGFGSSCLDPTASAIAASASGAINLYPVLFGCKPSSASSFWSNPLLSTMALK